MYDGARDSEAQDGRVFGAERYLEDFHAGPTFVSGRVRIDADRIKSFAAEFDPQPFHLDERAATESMFGGLAASSWHTAAITMRLLVDSDLRPAGGIVGAGFDEVSAGPRSHQGRTTTLNQHNEPVQMSVGHLIVRCRPSSSGE